MPKILITGNGFDLNIGLPTSYIDFIKILSYLEKNKIVTFASIYSISQNSEKIFNQFNNFDFNNEAVIILKKDIKTNLWFQFFKNEYEIETWIDFENKIEYVLQNLFSSVEYIKDNIFDSGSLKAESLRYSSAIFNNNFEIIEVLKKFEIITIDGYDTITLNTDFLIKKYGYFIDIDLDKITKHLEKELIEFKKIFNYYFEIFVVPFFDHPKNRLESVFKNITQHFTFNYTPTFDKIFNPSNTTKFLHGKINSKDNKIVLGINEVPKNEKVGKKYFLPFTKYFQKLNNNTDYVFINEYAKDKSSNYIFFFWGHSLDRSDEDYINEVFDFVINLKSNIKKIVIIYHNENSKSRLLINLLDIRGKKDIFELMRNGFLEFTHIESKELVTELNRDIANRGLSISIH